ncbi:Potassium/sodium uptake protein NtpJ [bioreactor metagenome]|uniref:Potassium/sodium uptake protein NtpJ n=1 Tax=bioreactor metagenome TaxID=1076179 RepID=A0A644XV52_9ZZZZ
MNKFLNKLTQSQTIALGFFIVILTGALLLMLPVASKDGRSSGFITSLFTAGSATCVTGLVVVDTYTHWTLFGQIVILSLIQIGGLGFITIGVLFSMLLKKNIDLRQRGLIKESVNTINIGGVVKLVRKIFVGTALFEGLGAVILASHFVPELGFRRGLYYGIFHSVSAFCNAGFDLMGYKAQYSSFVSEYDNILINVTIMSLITIGGLGFIVWDDISKNKLHFKKYMLHTKIVLSTTAIIIFGSAVLFYIFESPNLFVGMSFKGKILSSLFSAVTPRTAGFNTIDTAALTSSSLLLTIVIMFIGGSPGSTAGGVKTTTASVVVYYIWNTLRGRSDCNAFRRRVSDETIKKACVIICVNLMLGTIGTITICHLQSSAPIRDILFEVYSAIGTVGLSTGITRELTSLSRLIITLLMYCGRIGSITLALVFTETKVTAHVSLPEEKITIG